MSLLSSHCKCWCGEVVSHSFNSDYSLCDRCGTLIYNRIGSPSDFLVNDDDADFYGKNYWLLHQYTGLGKNDIYQRARDDLKGRNLFWLKTLLRYRLPPARVLDLGCGHGSFVAILQQAGFDARGVEMSPWVAEFGRKTFNVDIDIGPLENLDIAQEGLDVVVLTDVLEHFPDPMATMRCCINLLKPDGFMLIQTPQFKEGMTFEKMKEEEDRFLEMLLPDEHIYLFSPRSIALMFRQLGADHIKFEPAIFDHYDMFLLVSRVPIISNDYAQVENRLLASPPGRMLLAMIELYQSQLDSARLLKECEDDRRRRIEQIETLTNQLEVSEKDRYARFVQIQTLTRLINDKE